MKDIFKEFKPSSWSIDNKTSIFIFTVIITLAGLLAYNKIPKEQFPEVVFPQILVNTVYPGTSPADMENLVTKHIEKEVKAISGVKKVTSNSVQDFSMVNVEFNTDVDVSDAKQKVKDAVDKASSRLPSDLPKPPDVMDIDISQVPIMNVHLSGDYDLQKLKKYADDLKDKIEELKEIRRVDIIGALEREIQINLDVYKMDAAQITMYDVSNAIRNENQTISGGLVDVSEVKRSINVVGQFTDPKQIENIVVRGASGAVAKIKDIGEVKDDFEEKESYARLDKKNVITLNIIKKGGENLIEASDKIGKVCEEMKETHFPDGLKITITGDQSDETRHTLNELINTIIIGFILVTLILMFFMGATNALFVALSVPLSMFVAFLVMPTIGFSLNMIVLFAFLLALGIVVDDAIVVIENTHRIFDNGKVPIIKAAKMATGEIFLPVLSGTLTTLAPFLPLAFWQGVVGKFMFYLPVTLIITLLASLFVAYIINPVFAVQFMKPHHENGAHKKITRGFIITSIIFGVIALISYLGGNMGVGNFTIFLYLCFCFNKFIFHDITKKFQETAWPAFQNFYARTIAWFLKGIRPQLTLLGTVVLLIVSFILISIFPPKVVFFPSADPNFVYAYITLPIGTNQAYTDSVTQVVENKIYGVIGEKNPVVKSVISNVAVGANDPQSFDMSTSSHLGKVTVAFVQYDKRNGASTVDYLNKIREAVKDVPGAVISVEQESNGPPTGKPINIEVSGDDFTEIVDAANGLKRYLDSLQIPGVEELKTDLQLNKPEITVKIDRERAGREGITTGQIGFDIRTSIFGSEVSKFKDNNDEYPIMVRLMKDQRENMEVVMNQKITYRDMAMGGILRQVPIRSVADLEYANTYGGIKRKNNKRMITIYSNVLSNYNPNEVVAEIQKAAKNYTVPSGVTVNYTGEQEEQQETMGFLGMAMMISLGLIFMILVTQFNSLSKPIIILSEIIFSIIGVLLGFVFFRMDMSIVMVGIGMVALAGIVVRNGILLVEFTDILLEQGSDIMEAIIEAGRVRMTPVLLTASATIMGLIPLAVGFNIDFASLFTKFNPHIHFGGDSVAFWGPLSWTMIFGLAFATFLTLILVPIMYLLMYKSKQRVNKLVNKTKVSST